MKVPPKRKGNATLTSSARPTPNFASMKVPPKRKGNSLTGDETARTRVMPQ